MTTFEQVEINGASYDSFVTVAQADQYLSADPFANAWNALDDGDDKAKYLVQATRVLLRQKWEPGALDDPVPQAIRDATCELASAMADGFDAGNIATTDSNIKRQKAGTVEQEFFAPGIATPAGHRFPLAVWELLKGLLGGGGGDAGIGGSIATGVCGRSITDIPYGFGGDDWRRDADC